MDSASRATASRSRRAARATTMRRPCADGDGCTVAAVMLVCMEEMYSYAPPSKGPRNHGRHRAVSAGPPLSDPPSQRRLRDEPADRHGSCATRKTARIHPACTLVHSIRVQQWRVQRRRISGWGTQREGSPESGRWARRSPPPHCRPPLLSAVPHAQGRRGRQGWETRVCMTDRAAAAAHSLECKHARTRRSAQLRGEATGGEIRGRRHCCCCSLNPLRLESSADSIRTHT